MKYQVTGEFDGRIMVVVINAENPSEAQRKAEEMYKMSNISKVVERVLFKATMSDKERRDVELGLDKLNLVEVNSKYKQRKGLCR